MTSLSTNTPSQSKITSCKPTFGATALAGRYLNRETVEQIRRLHETLRLPLEANGPRCPRRGSRRSSDWDAQAQGEGTRETAAESAYQASLPVYRWATRATTHARTGSLRRSALKSASLVKKPCRSGFRPRPDSPLFAAGSRRNASRCQPNRQPHICGALVWANWGVGLGSPISGGVRFRGRCVYTLRSACSCGGGLQVGMRRSR